MSAITERRAGEPESMTMDVTDSRCSNSSYRSRTSALARPDQPRRRRALAAWIGGISLLAISSPALAEPERHFLYFRPSPSSGAVGYVVHLGLESGQYTQHVDIGAPSQDDSVLIYETDIDTSLNVYVALSTYNAVGISSAYSNETLVAATTTGSGDPPPAPEPEPDPTPPPPPTPVPDPGFGTTLSTTFAAAELGLTANEAGLISQVLGDGSTRPLTVDSLAAARDLRATRCDLDGDADRDFVIGFGPGSDGRVALLFMEEGAVDRVDSVVAGDADYHTADGQTYPACGDIDGDGAVELVVGMGPAADAELMVFDGADTNFAAYPNQNAGRFTAPTTAALRREGTSTVPALGDIDGDGLAELVIGYTAPENRLVAFLDDALRDFAAHEALDGETALVAITPVDESASPGGGTYPAVGDFDSDGRDEIVVGFGQNGGGLLLFMDDALAAPLDGYARHLEIQTGREAVRDDSGSARAAFGDIDGDDRVELVVGFGDGGRSQIQVFEDFLTGGTQLLRGGEGYVVSDDADAGWVAAP